MMKFSILRYLMAAAWAASIFACAPSVSKTPHDSLRPDTGPARLDNSYYYYTEAQLALKKGRMDQAIQLLLKASESDPASVFLDMELAAAYLSQKRTPEALLTLEKGLAINPDHVEALIFYGNINQDLNQNDKAIQAYTKAIEIAPDQEERVYLLLGGILMEEGDLDKAFLTYQDLVKTFPASFAGYFFLGKIHAQKNQPVEAEAAFIKALALEPELEEGRFELLKIYRDSGENEKERALYLELLDKNPGNVRAAMELGLFLS